MRKLALTLTIVEEPAHSLTLYSQRCAPPPINPSSSSNLQALCQLPRHPSRPAHPPIIPSQNHLIPKEANSEKPRTAAPPPSPPTRHAQLVHGHARLRTVARPFQSLFPTVSPSNRTLHDPPPIKRLIALSSLVFNRRHPSSFPPRSDAPLQTSHPRNHTRLLLTRFLSQRVPSADTTLCSIQTPLRLGNLVPGISAWQSVDASLAPCVKPGASQTIGQIQRPFITALAAPDSAPPNPLPAETKIGPAIPAQRALLPPPNRRLEPADTSPCAVPCSTRRFDVSCAFYFERPPPKYDTAALPPTYKLTSALDRV